MGRKVPDPHVSDLHWRNKKNMQNLCDINNCPPVIDPIAPVRAAHTYKTKFKDTTAEVQDLRLDFQIWQHFQHTY